MKCIHNNSFIAIGAVLINLFLSLSTVLAYANSKEKIFPLDYGKYTPGFRIIEVSDSSRPYREKSSTSSEGTQRARVIQLYVWYPSVSGSLPSIRFKDYLSPAYADSASGHENLKKYIFALFEEYGLLEEERQHDFTELMEMPTIAKKDSPFAQGKFPVVIFSNGLNADAITYTLTCEFLASHGIIAVSLPSRGITEGSKTPFDLRGIDMQVRDMESAISKLYELPGADSNKLALAAWSVGGVSTALLQMKNTDIDLLISLDGATGYHYGIEMLKNSIHYDINRATVPYIHMHGQRNRFDVPKDFTFFELLPHKNAFLLDFVEMDHYHFTSIGNCLNWIGKRDPILVRNFQLVNRYLLEFINKYLLMPEIPKTLAGSDSVIVFQKTHDAEPKSPWRFHIHFPTSGSYEAQRHFQKGIYNLHGFWYEQALAEFREATRIDPDFMMGYWGEAMAFNDPVFFRQDTEAGRKVLARLKPSSKLTQKEKSYLEAVKILYGNGEKSERDLSYAQAMEKIYRNYPDDLEAASFYALALLGIANTSSNSRDKLFKVRNQKKAAAIALDVLKQNPDHPGAANYVITAFDNPEHALLALPAAKSFAHSAPNFHLAQHLPSHIFLQLGMWSETVASNKASWESSLEWVQHKALPTTDRFYHSLFWLFYAYLQQGRYEQAENIVLDLREELTKSENSIVRSIYEGMATRFIIETERWSEIGKMLNDDGAITSSPPARKVRLSFTFGLWAAAQKQYAKADAYMKELELLNNSVTKQEGVDPVHLQIFVHQLKAVIAMARNDSAGAIDYISKAAELENNLPIPVGPPDIIKPSHELFGEILMDAGRPGEAAKQLSISLHRHPNRAKSLLAAARASAASGQRQKAVEIYQLFLKEWKSANSNLPELDEAKAYLKFNS